ncbi:MAG TPA: hypothetical protein VMV92_12275 [Streptosporangiaceae bacterium]|nr:hypothetical protein [Streptosporangiaceae bacterium]
MTGLSRPRLAITRCDEGHLQLIVASGVGEASVPVCIEKADVAGVIREMQMWAQVPPFGPQPAAKALGEQG